MWEFTGICVIALVLIVVGRRAFLWWYRRGRRERTYGYSNWFEQRAHVPWSGGNGRHDSNMKSNMTEAPGWGERSAMTEPQQWVALKNGTETPPDRG